jgi:hypothetical protein
MPLARSAWLDYEGPPARSGQPSQSRCLRQCTGTAEKSGTRLLIEHWTDSNISPEFPRFFYRGDSDGSPEFPRFFYHGDLDASPGVFTIFPGLPQAVFSDSHLGSVLHSLLFMRFCRRVQWS